MNSNKGNKQISSTQQVPQQQAQSNTSETNDDLPF